MPKFSVVIPVYNKGNYIEATIQSVLAQSFSDYEILLIDDGSTDGSLAILKQYQAENIILIDQENHGLSAARNTGIRHAKAELICLLDADDLWLPDHLSTLNELVELYSEAHLFATAYTDYFENGLCVSPKISVNLKNQHGLIADFFESSLQQPLFVPSSFAFYKNVVEVIGGFNPTITYAEDVDFYIRANLKYRLAYSKKITCLYLFESENQITHSQRSSKQVPDYQKYSTESPDNKTLQRYINLQQYFLCNYYKMEEAKAQFKAMRKNVNLDLLNYKQRFLLQSPPRLLKAMQKMKRLALKKGWRITTF